MANFKKIQQQASNARQKSDFNKGKSPFEKRKEKAEATLVAFGIPKDEAGIQKLVRAFSPKEDDATQTNFLEEFGTLVAPLNEELKDKGFNTLNVRIIPKGGIFYKVASKGKELDSVVPFEGFLHYGDLPLLDEKSIAMNVQQSNFGLGLRTSIYDPSKDRFNESKSALDMIPKKKVVLFNGFYNPAFSIPYFTVNAKQVMEAYVSAQEKGDTDLQGDLMSILEDLDKFQALADAYAFYLEGIYRKSGDKESRVDIVSWVDHPSTGRGTRRILSFTRYKRVEYTQEQWANCHKAELLAELEEDAVAYANENVPEEASDVEWETAVDKRYDELLVERKDDIEDVEAKAIIHFKHIYNMLESAKPKPAPKTATAPIGGAVIKSSNKASSKRAGKRK